MSLIITTFKKILIQKNQELPIPERFESLPPTEPLFRIMMGELRGLVVFSPKYETESVKLTVLLSGLLLGLEGAFS